MNSRLCQRVLRRLGFASPPALNLGGLRAIYRAWSAAVPFDNVRKMIALRSSPQRPLPGGSAGEFFEGWLSYGAGGTCWPTSNAQFELLHWLGFTARRITGSMRDLGIVNHASVKVDRRAWLADSSALSNVPLPLTNEVFIHDDPVFTVEVEPEKHTHVGWIHTPPNSAALPCRLNQDPATHGFYLSRYEESRACIPFNQRLYARRNRPAERLVLLGSTRLSKTAEGGASRDLSPDEVCEALHRDIGLSKDLIDHWVRSGSLADSFQPSSTPKPPPGHSQTSIPAGCRRRRSLRSQRRREGLL